MKISIVTPCRNAEEWIADTVRSVRDQTFLDDPANCIQYIVVDGASSDGTVDQVKLAWTPHERATLEVISEPDRGMYDALSKGLARCSGDVVAYLNAGDYYSRHALALVEQCFTRFSVRWLTGMRVTYSDEGAMISAKVPWRYDRALVEAGHYGVRGWGRFIQQESTFWSRDLLVPVDYQELAKFRLAGDLYLWTRFAQQTSLEVVAAHLGGFRFHGGHLSDAMHHYKAEAKNFLARPRWSGYLRTPLQEILSWIPVPVRARMPGRHSVIQWDRESGHLIRR